MASPSPTPWKEWSFDLPLGLDASVPSDFHTLTDPGVRADLLEQVRKNAFDRLGAALFEATGSSTQQGAAIVLSGGKASDYEYFDTDTSKCVFRQESFFMYLVGVEEPDVHAVLDLGRREVHLFVPEVPPDARRWMGEPKAPEWYNKRYRVASTRKPEEMHDFLTQRGLLSLFLLGGVNSDSGLEFKTPGWFPELDQPDSPYAVNRTVLRPLLSECRCIKTPLERDFLRAAARVSSQAHVYVMRHFRAGMMERMGETLFQSWTGLFGGARAVAYTCICASGENGAILHYGHAGEPNARTVRAGDSVVFDMGGEYGGYATDITTSYPVGTSGKFSAEQRMIHEATLAASVAVLGAMKPGVLWPDMHRLAERVVAEHLVRAGVFQLPDGTTMEDLLAAHAPALVMPHGLGHLLGLDVHDVGGFTDQFTRLPEPGVRWLRTTRPLMAGMVITVEPGVYLNEPWIRSCLKDWEAVGKFVNMPEMERLFKLRLGGCRIEDDVLVTDSGVENLSVLPRTVDEIEEVLRDAQERADAVKALRA